LFATRTSPHARTHPCIAAAPRLLLLQGYAFAEFLDVHVTDIVIQNLNGKPCNTKFLTGG
jgi:hypothetical protein